MQQWVENVDAASSASFKNFCKAVVQNLNGWGLFMQDINAVWRGKLILFPEKLFKGKLFFFPVIFKSQTNEIFGCNKFRDA